MARRKLTMILLCLTMVGGSMAMAPTANAAVEDPDLPCEAFARPYDYPCGVAEQTAVFVWNQATGVLPFAEALVDEADELADAVYHTASCTVNPDDPECP